MQNGLLTAAGTVFNFSPEGGVVSSACENKLICSRSRELFVLTAR